MDACHSESAHIADISLFVIEEQHVLKFDAGIPLKCFEVPQFAVREDLLPLK
jgi:hypothetical protein